MSLNFLEKVWFDFSSRVLHLRIQPSKMFEPRLQLEILPGRRKRINELQLIREQNESKRSMFASCGENLHQYLLNSTLHGLKYVADKKIARWER